MGSGSGGLQEPGWVIERIDGAPSESLLGAVRELSEAAKDVDGAVPLSDAVVLSPGPGSIHLCCWADAAAVDDGGLDGYAHVDSVSGTAEIVVRPSARRRGLGGALMAAALDAGGRSFWAHGDLPAATALAADQGARADRTLLLLERRGAGGGAAGELPDGFRLRPYRGPADDAGLLRVNAAAFTDLPDQGGWTIDDLRARLAADWFDPEGLLVLEREPGASSDDIVGFHWTKIHPDGSGEVYVLALDPEVQGHGLAGPLTRAGLDQLERRGCAEVILFVDSDNSRALRLYEGIGFGQQRRDVLYAAPGPAL